MIGYIVKRKGRLEKVNFFILERILPWRKEFSINKHCFFYIYSEPVSSISPFIPYYNHTLIQKQDIF